MYYDRFVKYFYNEFIEKLYLMYVVISPIYCISLIILIYFNFSAPVSNIPPFKKIIIYDPSTVEDVPWLEKLQVIYCFCNRYC